MKKLDLYFENSKNPIKKIIAGKADYSFLEKDAEHKKCLPLKIAGEMGWDLLLSDEYVINWNGGNKSKDISIISNDTSDFLSTGLGHGIISFKIPYLFELEKDTFLWIKGSSNNPLSLDLYACEGVVEADWFPSHITMNYKIITKDKDIVLSAGKPYCRILPYPKNYIETFLPTYKKTEDNPKFSSKYMTYNFYNRFMPFSKQYLTSYIKGFLGKEKMENVPKIKLSTPQQDTEIPSKCPFHKALNKLK